MNVYRELAEASPPGETVLTIGTFDGVHLGHQALFGRLKEAAVGHNLRSSVLTFRNHPRTVLRPEVELRCITTPQDRLRLLQEEGIDSVIAVDFTMELASIEAAEFVGLLAEHLKMRGLVVGPDFALGHRRRGDIPTLKRLGREIGFWVEEVEPGCVGGLVVKSSMIRKLISEGDVGGAATMLGRVHSVMGVVVEGDRRGRSLGFPTVNLDIDPQVVIPSDGIYATWALVEGRRHGAATSIGVRPTFEGGLRTVEAFILDFDGDLYGETVTLEFVQRLRDELAFPDSAALVEQMRADVELTRATLGAYPEGSRDGAPSDVAQER